MAVVCSNQNNVSNMKTNYHVGVLNVPDNHPTSVLFSPAQAECDFRQMNYDVYEKRSQYSYLDNKKAPKSLLVLLAGGVALGIYKFARVVMKK